MGEKRPAIDAFYEAPGACMPGQRRALLLAFHFPPSQAAGALRWQKMLRDSAQHGWSFDVLTLDPRELRTSDPSRLSDLPSGTRVFGVPSPPLAVQTIEEKLSQYYRRIRSFKGSKPPAQHEGASVGSAASLPRISPPAADDSLQTTINARPSSLGRQEQIFRATEFRSWWRAYQAWTEVRRGDKWAQAATMFGQQLFDPNVHTVVISSGPPEMPHIGALNLADDCKLPLFLDFRDPWSLRERLPEHMASPLWYYFARKYERQAVERANKVIMNTDPARDAMKQIYPDIADRFVSIPNGCDEDPIAAIPMIPRSRQFRVAYAGALYLDRNPNLLFRAAARVIREQALTPEDFSIEFMGYVDPLLRIEEAARDVGIQPYLQIHPSGTRAEAAQFLAESSMLVSLPQDSHMAIPSKIYEYMRHEVFVLALAERDSATERLLRDTDADVASPDDEERIGTILTDRFRDWREGKRPEPVAATGQFDRGLRSAEFFALLDRFGRESDRVCAL